MKKILTLLVILLAITATSCKKESKYIQAEVWKENQARDMYYIVINIEGQIYNVGVASKVVPTQLPSNIVWVKGMPQVILLKERNITIIKPKI